MPREGATLTGRPWPQQAETATRRTMCLCCLGMVMGGLVGGVRAEAAEGAASANLPPPLADYHLHIQGPEISEAMRRLQARNPALFQAIDPAFLKPRTGADALKLLDAAGIQHGVVLSEAYMFGSPLMAPDHPDVASLTRAENAYNVAEAEKSGGRLMAFIGVDPISPTALPEIEYWAARHGVGVKLHLANSLFDFNAPAQMAQLRDVFASARSHRMPIIIHLRNRLEWGAGQANAFIDQILPSAGRLPITVAHGAGWGDINGQTVEALRAFGAALAAKKPGTEALTFDLALVTTPTQKPDDPAHFVDAMREIGMSRFRFGSDWPARYTPGEEVPFLEKTLPLTRDEWRVIRAHRAKYLPRVRTA